MLLIIKNIKLNNNKEKKTLSSSFQDLIRII